MSAASEIRPGGNDAVCFTAGAKGAAFGAGVIHAWLASDREPPLVAAGISMGALSSAAMQKAYRELEAAAGGDVERLRWTWFRRYLDVVTNEPLRFLWKALPDPVDFFADKPPVHDLSVPRDLQHLQPGARRHFHVLTKLGIWVAGLPVRVSTAASIMVHRVRWKERYGWWRLSAVLYYWNIIKALAGVWWHLMRAPRFFSERSFNGYFFRPLFGWLAWLGSFLPLFCVGVIIALHSHWLAAVLAFLGAGAVLAVAVKLGGLDIGTYLFRQLNLQRGLLNQFEFKRVIFDLFGTGKPDPSLRTPVSEVFKRMHVLLVCAALENTKQVWPRSDVDLVTGLSAALAVAGLFPPVKIETGKLDFCEGVAGEASVIDGVAVRSNPIPAFFDWCARNRSEAERIEPQPGDPPELPKLHVVYNVPKGPEGGEAGGREMIDIVESMTTALELEKRRDTRQEVRQTNFLAGLESVRRRAAGKSPDGCFAIFADEIAPAREIDYRNEWEPTREEGLAAAAQGCANALETLYRYKIRELANGRDTIACSELMREVAPRRREYICGDAGGLPEICTHCPRTLAYRPEERDGEPAPGVIRGYGEPGAQPRPELDQLFPHLTGNHGPRIVFLGSGGVFRGAFHIGVIGAMKAAGIYPDLVVGASVGALMGGALATISVASPADESKILNKLASVFLDVDERVALTYSLKNAAKQLGIRARDVFMSPAELRRLVIGGSRADAGFAATGAPPALIDAISSLFMIPHRRTSAIASSFVAGHITEAVNRFLTQVRRETLTSFEIQRALMGTSLLEPQARELLGRSVPQVQLDRVQPYHFPAPEKRPVSFFCTTAFLNTRTSLLLGRDFLTPDPSWDFIYAALSSSAFPLVFSPRSEAEVLPGRGRSDRLFADGGMFDNLPFFPAIEILGSVQSYGRSMEPVEVMARLKARTTKRDIIIAAGLDAQPGNDSGWDTLFQIKARAKTLSVCSKVETFINASGKAQKMLKEIAYAAGSGLGPEDAKRADAAVTAVILKIVPSDKDHINPTFAFCRSVGLEKDKVRRSIADGCFQSLRAFEKARTDPETEATFKQKNFRPLEYKYEKGVAGSFCPYFHLGDAPLECPFAREDMAEEVRKTRQICAADKIHQIA